VRLMARSPLAAMAHRAPLSSVSLDT
jgi:hypothetical protein